MNQSVYARERALEFIDLSATFVLAIQGAAMAADRGLDVFGIAAVSLATALGGGVVRDVLIGETPPEALQGWPIVTVAVIGALMTLCALRLVEELPETVLATVDALGLSLLAVSGAEKALDFRLTPLAAVMMGVIASVGGYTIRDILLAEVPAVLRVDFFATAALAGAAVLVVLRSVRINPNIAAALGGTTCFVLRMTAYFRHWQLPTIPTH
jgi:uncharacterized membrane protein YeiH